MWHTQGHTHTSTTPNDLRCCMGLRRAGETSCPRENISCWATLKPTTDTGSPSRAGNHMRSHTTWLRRNGRHRRDACESLYHTYLGGMGQPHGALTEITNISLLLLTANMNSDKDPGGGHPARGATARGTSRTCAWTVSEAQIQNRQRACRAARDTKLRLACGKGADATRNQAARNVFERRRDQPLCCHQSPTLDYGRAYKSQCTTALPSAAKHHY